MISKASARSSVARTRAPRAPIPTWQAPSDFKPFFAEIVVKTDKDGLLAPVIRGTRFQGRWKPDVEPKKKFDMATYDQPTLTAVLSRLSMVTYTAGAAKRLPSNQIYRLIIRVMKKSKDNSVGTRLIQIDRVKRLKSGRVKLELLDKMDADYRKFRKAFRCILPCAFKSVLLPPKRTRASKTAEE